MVFQAQIRFFQARTTTIVSPPISSYVYLRCHSAKHDHIFVAVAAAFEYAIPIQIRLVMTVTRATAVVI